MSSKRRCKRRKQRRRPVKRLFSMPSKRCKSAAPQRRRWTQRSGRCARRWYGPRARRRSARSQRRRCGPRSGRCARRWYGPRARRRSARSQRRRCGPRSGRCAGGWHEPRARHSSARPRLARCRPKSRHCRALSLRPGRSDRPQSLRSASKPRRRRACLPSADGAWPSCGSWVPGRVSESRRSSRSANLIGGEMALGRMVDFPRLGLLRPNSDFIALADRARDARQWDLAAQLYRKALDRHPRNPPIWVQYGHALKESGELQDPHKLAQADLAYRRALSLDPGGADAYLQLGHVLKLQGKTEDAQAAYLRAFALDAAISDSLEELRKLGWSQVKLAELRGMAKGRIGDRGFSRVHPGGARFTEDVGAARGLGTREPVEVPVVGANAIHRDAALITSKRAADGPESSCASGKTTVQRRIIDLDQWRSEVVLADPTLAVGLDRPIGIFVHLFYEDLAEEIASFLVRIDLPKKIYVSTGSDEKRTVILRAFEKFDLASLAEIAIVPDYGTDITPLLITFIDKLSEHDICLKLHSKKSLNAPPEFGEGWRKYLFDELIGDYDRVRAIVATMLVSTDLGLLMAQHYPPLVSSIGMGENFELVRDILAKISVDLVPDQKLEFPAGSMFWFRSDALPGLAGLGFNWHDFGHAVDHRDGTLAHAMERSFAFFCANAGKKWGFLPSRENSTHAHTRSGLAQPVFSVIIPVYDRTWELREALDSVLSQCFPDFEVIIVTDATPAETMAIIHEYVDKDQRVRAFFYTDNSGNACRGRNRGILEARGEFISLLDSDDIFFPNTLNMVYRIFREQPVDFVCGRAYFIVDGTRRVGDFLTGSTTEVSPINMDRFLRGENPIQTCTVHIRRDLLLKFGGFRFEQKYLEDLELWLRLAYHGCRFYYSDELFAKYRFHQGNLELKYIDQKNYWLEHMRNNYLRPFDDWGIGEAVDCSSFPGGESHDAVPVWPGRVDADWYGLQYPDIARAGADPLEHFIGYGRREGRKPNAAEARADGWVSVLDVEISCLKRPVLREEIALFATYCPHGRLKPHVRHYLDCVTRQGVAVVLIVAVEEAFTDADADLMSKVDGIFVRKAIGYDFAAWAHILRLHSELSNANILFLLNDSVFGPTNDTAFNDLLYRIRHSNAEFIGLTESFERSWHLQSYFLALKSRVLASTAFRYFIENIVCYLDKEQVITSYELRFAQIMKIAGFRCEAMFQITDIRNPTIFHWRQLLDAGFPFLKVVTVRDAFPGVDVADWRQVLAAQGYDVSPAERTLYEDSAAGRMLHETCQSVADRRSGRARGRGSTLSLDVLIFMHDLTESGAPRAAFDVARILRDAGHFVAVVSPSDGPYRARLSNMGIDVIVIDPENERARWTPELLFRKGSDVLDLARDFDKVICNTVECWPIVSQLRNTNAVYWYVHESESIRQMAADTPELVPVLSSDVTFLAPSHLPAKALAEYGVKTHIVGLGVDDRPDLTVHFSGDGKVVIGVFGSYEPRKAQDLAVKGMMSLSQQLRGQAELRLFGRTLDAEFRQDVEQIASGDPSVVFFGEVDHDECLRQMAASDIILVPSRDDPLPFVTLDALSLGKALVCSSSVGTSAYLRQGTSGLILHQNTPEEIGSALARLISDRQLRKTLGAGARQVYEQNFTVPVFTAKLFSALDVEKVSAKTAIEYHA